MAVYCHIMPRHRASDTSHLVINQVIHATSLTACPSCHSIVCVLPHHATSSLEWHVIVTPRQRSGKHATSSTARPPGSSSLMLSSSARGPCLSEGASRLRQKPITSFKAASASAAAVWTRLNGGMDGRGLHSSTSQVNVSRFCHSTHPERPLHTPCSPNTP